MRQEIFCQNQAESHSIDTHGRGLESVLTSRRFRTVRLGTRSEIMKQRFRTEVPRKLASAGVFLAMFAVFLAAIHRPYLKLPFHWDEMGQFVPASLDHLSQRRLGAPLHAAQRASAGRNGIGGAGMARVRLLNAGTLNFGRAIGHAGRSFAGRAVRISAGHPACAGRRGSAGVRRCLVSAGFAAVLHAVHDGAAGHARDDADGAGSASVSGGPMGMVRGRVHAPGADQGDRRHHALGVRARGCGFARESRGQP